MQKMTNREKFKAMNRKEKIQYIWEYYKLHIIGTLLAIFAIGEIFRIATMPRPDYKVHTMISGRMAIDTEKQEEDAAMFYEKLGSDLYYMPADWHEVGQATLMNEQLLNLKLQVRELDVLAISSVRHQNFMQIDRYDAFVKLDTIPELAPLLERYKDQLLTGISKEDGKEYVFGIKTTQVSGLPNIQLGEEYIISLINPPKDMEAAIQVMEYLLQ